MGGVGVGGFRIRSVRGALSALRFGALGINTGLHRDFSDRIWVYSGSGLRGLHLGSNADPAKSDSLNFHVPK